MYLGKERVYLSVAKHFNKKVVVDKPRYKMICCYHEYTLADKSILTVNEPDSNLLVVNMSQLNFNNMELLKKKYSTRGVTRVVAISPTGWSYSPGNNGYNKAGKGVNANAKPNVVAGANTDITTSIISERRKGIQIIIVYSL